jgi:hypothetical protein
MSKLLDHMTQLARESRKLEAEREVAKVDWDAVDRKLFARLEAERRAERSQVVVGRSPAWGFGAAALAAAAAVALIVGKTRETESVDAPVVANVAPAGTVMAVASGAQLLVDGKPAAAGAVLHLGDVVEARGGTVTVERPGKLSWLLEPSSIATVTHVQGALVLALDRGAVEAQVVPVAAGEAFAVDVDGSRVAVHGTHLRVARIGDHVSVDLSEGVIVVGLAPRTGSTIGALVTAPAHAEFAPTDSKAMIVSHDPSAVRAPVVIGAQSAAAPMQGPAVAVAAPPPKSNEARPSPAFPVPPRPQFQAPQQVPPQPPPPQPPQPDPNAASVVAAAVRSCMAARTSADNVTVVVSTTVHMDLDADGNVRAARFDPPVAPDVNSCAAPVIYRTRFTHDGSADVPVDFRVPGPVQ